MALDREFWVGVAKVLNVLGWADGTFDSSEEATMQELFKKELDLTDDEIKLVRKSQEGDLDEVTTMMESKIESCEDAYVVQQWLDKMVVSDGRIHVREITVFDTVMNRLRKTAMKKSGKSLS